MEEWNIKSREDAIDYAMEREYPFRLPRRIIQHGRNLWHLSHEGSDLEDPWNEPDYEKILKLMVAPKSPRQADVYRIDI